VDIKVAQYFVLIVERK